MESFVLRETCKVNLDLLPMGSIIFKNNSAYGRAKKTEHILFRFSKIPASNSAILRINTSNRMCDIILSGSFSEENKQVVKNHFDSLISFLERIPAGNRLKFEEFQLFMDEQYDILSLNLVNMGPVKTTVPETRVFSETEQMHHEEIEELSRRLHFS